MKRFPGSPEDSRTPHARWNDEPAVIEEGETMEKKLSTGTKQTDKVFDGHREARLGTEKRPAAVTVQTEERSREVAALFEENGWKYTIELDPDKPEDVTDLDILLHPQQPKVAEAKVGRNEPCPCGSGKKYKKCCGA
jgi:SWIM/SEC-C metal-binding protein